MQPAADKTAGFAHRLVRAPLKITQPLTGGLNLIFVTVDSNIVGRNAALVPEMESTVKRIAGNRIVSFFLYVVCIAGVDGTALRAEPTSTQPATSTAGPVATSQSSAKSDAFDEANASAGGELLLFKDLPIVVSASRQAQPINLSGAPISVVSQDQIHYGAQTTIADVLSFVPGVDVSRVDRENFAVGVHGLNNVFADRTLTLINGRDATDPIFGGTDWLAMPVFMEDIERIEVVRGPGGAAWGADAFNGVVNIITKDPKNTPGALASTTIDQFGDSYTQVRYAGGEGKVSYRVSAGYEDRKSSGDALDGAPLHTSDSSLDPLIRPGSLNANDALRNARTDSVLSYQFTPDTKLSVGVATAHIQRGDPETLGFQSDKLGFAEIARGFARLDVKSSNTDSGYIQWFTNYGNENRPNFGRYWDVENDLEAQYTLELAKTNKLTLGGNVRLTDARILPNGGNSLLESERSNEYWTGLFLVDRWQAAERLAVEGQIRGDYYSGTGADWSGRLSGLYSLDSANNNVLRLSVAKAFRAPQLGIRDLEGSRVALPLPPPLPSNLNLFNLVRNPDLENEEVRSLEAGYTAAMGEGLWFRADGFYQKYSNLIGGEGLRTTAFGQQFFHLANVGNAEAYGGELELTYEKKNYKLSAWYGYNHFLSLSANPNTRSFMPPDNSVGFSALWHITHQWTIEGQYRFMASAQTNALSTAFQPASYNLLDLALSYAFLNNNAEFTVGINDLLDQTHHADFEDGSFTSHDIPGRTIFADADAVLTERPHVPIAVQASCLPASGHRSWLRR